MLKETNDQEFVISRDYDAPRALVFECFTDAAHLQHWWGPKGVTIVKPVLDFRVGGTFHYGMQTRDGKVMYGLQVYREITPPKRIVLINSFADEEGNVAPVPFPGPWPLEMLSTFTFEELGPRRTRFTVHWTPHNATEEEKATFAKGHASMTGGWTGTLDQLGDYLMTFSKA